MSITVFNRRNMPASRHIVGCQLFEHREEPEETLSEFFETRQSSFAGWGVGFLRAVPLGRRSALKRHEKVCLDRGPQLRRFLNFLVVIYYFCLYLRVSFSTQPWPHVSHEMWNHSAPWTSDLWHNQSCRGTKESKANLQKGILTPTDFAFNPSLLRGYDLVRSFGRTLGSAILLQQQTGAPEHFIFHPEVACHDMTLLWAPALEARVWQLLEDHRTPRGIHVPHFAWSYFCFRVFWNPSRSKPILLFSFYSWQK